MEECFTVYAGLSEACHPAYLVDIFPHSWSWQGRKIHMEYRQLWDSSIIHMGPIRANTADFNHPKYHLGER